MRYTMIVPRKLWIAAATLLCLVSVDSERFTFAGDFAFRAVRYDSDSYWEYSCVIIAIVNEVRPSSAGGHLTDVIVVNPVGTLSGRFDAGRNAEIAVLGQNAAYGLRKGDTVLMALFDPSAAHRESRKAVVRPRATLPYLADEDPFPYMPQDDLGIEKITGFSDEKVQHTLAAIQALRKKPEVNAGTGSRYWDGHSVVCADVETVGAAQGQAERYDFRILGTVSGCCDPGTTRKLSVVLDSGARHSMLDERVLDLQPHDTVLLMLEREGLTGCWHIPEERAAFMPFTHDPIITASRSWGPQPNNAVGEAIDSMLGEIQKRRVREAIPRN
jgi:hypothetical protein